MKFDHVGLIANEKKADENWVETTRVWVTDPKNHPFHIEWLRFEPDTPVKNAVREKAHVAYQVENIAKAAAGLKVLLAPFEVGGFVRVGFFESKDGAVIELMQYLKGADTWFGKRHEEKKSVVRIKGISKR